MKRTDLCPLSAFLYPSKMLRTVHYIFNERDVGISTAGLDRDESSSPIQAEAIEKNDFYFLGSSVV